MAVEPQKTEHAAEHSAGEQIKSHRLRRKLRGQPGDERQAQYRDRHRAARQAIQAVGQIHGIRTAQNYQGGPADEQPGREIARDRQPCFDRQRRLPPLNQKSGDDRADGKLSEELGPRAETLASRAKFRQVVDGANGSESNHYEQRQPRARKTPIGKQDERERNSGQDKQSAHRRRGAFGGLQAG